MFGLSIQLRNWLIKSIILAAIPSIVAIQVTIQFALATPLIEILISFQSLIITQVKLTSCMLICVYSPIKPRYINNQIIDSLHS